VDEDVTSADTMEKYQVSAVVKEINEVPRNETKAVEPYSGGEVIKEKVSSFRPR
jgi:hypothetical protein